jgi:hypothetical protein
VRACQEEEYLTDEDTAKAYGFMCFVSAIDRHISFRLYRKLVNIAGVGDEELRSARQEIKLKEFILARCAQLPRALVGEAMDWLRR